MEIKLEKEPLKISTTVGAIELIPFYDAVGYCIKIVGNDGVETETIEELSSRTIVVIHKRKDDEESKDESIGNIDDLLISLCLD